MIIEFSTKNVHTYNIQNDAVASITKNRIVHNHCMYVCYFRRIIK